MKKNSLLVLVAFLCVSAFGGVVVEVGDTEKEVLQRNPDVLGSGMMQGKKMLMYSDARVFLEDGIVVSFEGDAGSEQALEWMAEQKEAEANKKREFEQKQRDQGLIFYCGSWITPEEKKRIERNNEKARRQKVAKQEAKLLELKAHLQKQKIRIQTIIRIHRNSKSNNSDAGLEIALADINLRLIDIDNEIKYLQKSEFR